MPHPDPLVRRSAPCSSLASSYPPVFRHPHKRLVHSLLTQVPEAGEITVSRWGQEDIPGELRWADMEPPRVVIRSNIYNYLPEVPEALEWHLNFAHSTLFVAYGGPLFAQDEMQVAEHPILASVHEWMRKTASGPWAPYTRVDEEATPILIRGASRRGVVATEPDVGRSSGLYGNAFGAASSDVIRRATAVLDPPTVTNLLAMEAPTGGTGRYTYGEIRGVLTTAYTGFRAMMAESDGSPVVLHTGHWGTGAYGGARELMATLQLLAAQAAGVPTVVFHTFDEAGMLPVMASMTNLAAMTSAAPTVEAAITALEVDGFSWGESDGN